MMEMGANFLSSESLELTFCCSNCHHPKDPYLGSRYVVTLLVSLLCFFLYQLILPKGF